MAANIEPVALPLRYAWFDSSAQQIGPTFTDPDSARQWRREHPQYPGLALADLHAPGGTRYLTDPD